VKLLMSLTSSTPPAIVIALVADKTDKRVFEVR
jgi:hypothetical protein